jgi:hypothetical protein
MTTPATALSLAQALTAEALDASGAGVLHGAHAREPARGLFPRR